MNEPLWSDWLGGLKKLAQGGLDDHASGTFGSTIPDICTVPPCTTVSGLTLMRGEGEGDARIGRPDCPHPETRLKTKPAAANAVAALLPIATLRPQGVGMMGVRRSRQ